MEGVQQRLGSSSALGCIHGGQPSWGEGGSPNLLSLLTGGRWAIGPALFWKTADLPSIGCWNRGLTMASGPSRMLPSNERVRKAYTVLFLSNQYCVCMAVILVGKGVSLGSLILQHDHKAIFSYPF